MPHRKNGTPSVLLYLKPSDEFELGHHFAEITRDLTHHRCKVTQLNHAHEVANHLATEHVDIVVCSDFDPAAEQMANEHRRIIFLRALHYEPGDMLDYAHAEAHGKGFGGVLTPIDFHGILPALRTFLPQPRPTTAP